MQSSLLNHIDRTTARSALRGTTSSIPGLLGTLLMVGLLLWLYIPEIIYYLAGKYFQSNFEIQQPPYTRINIPKAFKAAIVFNNNTDQSIANHSLLAQQATFKAYLTQMGSQKYEAVEQCDPNYFSNTINPITLEDCFIFPANSQIDFSYYSNTASTFGFTSQFSCRDPFFCKSGSTFYTSVQNNYTQIFSNYSFTLYFTSTIITSEGEIKDQLFNISSSQWNTPLTITAQAGVELEVTNITIDESILPWKDIRMLTTTSFSGNLAGTAVGSTAIYITPPRAYFFNSNYQNQSYRYYQKLDLLLGIIGGGMLLLYLIFFVPFHYLNQCIFHMRVANEALIEIDILDSDVSHTHFKEVHVSKWYILERLLPWRQNECIREVKRVLDIVQIVKMMKVADKNIIKTGIQRYNKDRKLRLQSQQEQKKLQSIRPQEQSMDNIRENGGQGLAVQQLERDRISNPLLNMNQQEKQSLSQKLNIKPIVLEAILTSPESSHLLATNPTILALCNKQDSFISSIRDLGYDRYKQPPVQNSRIIQKCCDCLSKFLRFFDCFGVRPQLNPGIQSSSLCGLLTTIIILGLTILFCITAIAGANDTQVMMGYDFQSPEEINYSITTGKLVRPMLCLSSTVGANAITSNSPTINLTFYVTSSKGTLSRSWVNPTLEQILELGIQADSPYFNAINRASCFIMLDDQELEMGGLGTDHEAYFGFRFSPYCSGTASFCQSISSTLRSTITSWINAYPATLYLPISTFSQQTKSIISGGVYPQPIREGTSSFSTTSAVQQTLYVDQMRLLDSSSKRFVGIEPPLLQQTITTSQYQQAANIRGVSASLPYYEVRIRPSGRVLNVYLKGTTIDVLLGMIGGIFTIFWGLFHCFGKTYNHFNLRHYLAKEVYNEQQSTFIQKLWAAYALPVPGCFFEQFKASVDYLRRLDRKIQFDLQALEMLKEIYTIYYLSAGEYESLEEKHAALIYLKEKINVKDSVAEENDQNQQNTSTIIVEYQWEDEGDLAEQESSNRAISANVNQVNNQFQPHTQVAPNNLANDASFDRLASQQARNIDEIEPQDRHRGPLGMHEQRWRQKLAFFDWFNTKPEFTLQGAWRIKSVFGACLSFGMIACILLMFSYYITIFHTTQNQIISHERKIEKNTVNSSAWALHPDIFRLAVGFYQKPNSTFLNVDTFTTSNVAVGLEQIILTRNTSGFLSRSNTLIEMIKCPESYFDGFKDKNTDYSFLVGVTNGYCVPSNVTLQLSSIWSNPLQYFRIRIYNRTSASSSTNALSSLVNSYQVGLFMTVPVINVVKRRFQYTVQQIRGFSNPATRSIEYNITLSKQKITFTTPNYTVYPQSQSIETYNYIHNKYDERFYSSPTSAAPRQYNITISYQGHIEEYTVTYDHFGELFGLAGGIVALYLCAVSLLAESFNTFKMKYLIAKELYLLYSQSKQKANKKKKNKKQVQSNQSNIKVDFNEMHLLWAWLLSFSSRFLCSSSTLVAINVLLKKVESDLDLVSFFKKYRNLKDTINNKYKLSKNPDILASNLFVKLPFVVINAQNGNHEMSQQHLPIFPASYNLSRYEQIKICHLLRKEIDLSKIFNHQDIIAVIKDNQLVTEEVLENNMRPEARDSQLLLHSSYERQRNTTELMQREAPEMPSLINVQLPDSNLQRADESIGGKLPKSISEKKSEKALQQAQQQIAKQIIKHLQPVEVNQNYQER